MQKKKKKKKKNHPDYLYFTLQGDKDFPPEAVKHYHDKPLPSKDHRPIHKPHNIQQPR